MIKIDSQWVIHKPLAHNRKTFTPYMVFHKNRWKRVLEDEQGQYVTDCGNKTYVEFGMDWTKL